MSITLVNSLQRLSAVSAEVTGQYFIEFRKPERVMPRLRTVTPVLDQKFNSCGHGFGECVPEFVEAASLAVPLLSHFWR